MKNNSIEGAIFSADKDLAYIIRNKASEQNIKLRYLHNIKDLMEFIVKNNNGLLVIDVKYIKFTPLIDEYVKNKDFCKFVVIYLNEDDKIDFDICKNSILTNCENFTSALDSAKHKLLEKENQKNIIPYDFVELDVMKVLKELHIPSSSHGYIFLKNAVISALMGDAVICRLNVIYQNVAKNLNTTKSNVEKCIRKAIEKSKTHNPESYEIEEFRNKKITNLVIFCYIQERVKLDYLESIKDKQIAL